MMAFVRVPELTNIAEIKLNARVLLRGLHQQLRLILTGQFPQVRAHRGKAVGRLYSARRLCFPNGIFVAPFEARSAPDLSRPRFSTEAAAAWATDFWFGWSGPRLGQAYNHVVNDPFL
jgi:hypothetical protein